jgi:hypothetical protein
LVEASKVSKAILQDMQDNCGMNVAAAFLNSTPAARTVTIVLLAALAGLATDAFLKLAYGKPAPAQAAATASLNADKPTPQWLAGGDTAQAAEPSDIKLLGVVAQGNDGRQGYALIQATGKRAQVLHVGQSLIDGTQLLRVQGKTATLNIGGQDRLLTLEATSTSTVAVNNAMPSPPQASTPNADNAAQQAQQLAQIQQLQQAAAATQVNAVAQPAAVPTLDSAVGGQPRRRMGGRP